MAEEPKPVWCVWRESNFSTHWSDPVPTFGPFATKEEAVEFCQGPYGGHVYDATKEHINAQ